MTLVRYRPLNRFEAIHKHMGGLLNNFDFNENDSEMVQQVWKPRVDIVEAESDYKVMADLPGMKNEDVNITLEDNVLTISGERTEKNSNNKNEYYLNERAQGKFSRRINIKNTINVEKINAVFSNGVLTITLPKKEAVLPRKIEIKSAE